MPVTHLDLGRRERQIMEVIYRLGTASVGEVHRGLSDPPSYSTVRAMLVKLEHKGRVRHVQSGKRFLYKPTSSRRTVQRSTVRRVVQSLFDGSTEQTVAALLDAESGQLDDDALDRIAELVESFRKGRK